MDATKELYSKKFKNDETFQIISKKFVSMNENKKKLNDSILKQIILDRIVPKMTLQDENYGTYFKATLLRGSVTKQLKVSKPDEYDLLLLIKLPIDYGFIQAETNCKPGSVKLRVVQPFIDRNEFIWSKMLTDNNYLDQNKFREWVHSILVRALNSLNHYSDSSDGYAIKTKRNIYIIKFKTSNPAFTLEVKAKNAADSEIISFDLVPSMQFKDKPLDTFKLSEKNEWTVVAKPMHSEVKRSPEILWRPSFYEDEKKILKLNGDLKPIIRMVKKLRDTQNWTDIKSYFIETLFYHELENPVFENNYRGASRMNIFVYMIKRLRQVIESGKLKNYWHSGHNLLEKIATNKPERLNIIARELEDIINEVNDKPTALKEYFKNVKN